MRLPFRIVPVLDLKTGEVVRARAGERDTYLRMVSPLAKSSAPVDVLDGLRSLAPFRTVYAADLDTIVRAGDNTDTIESLAAHFAGMEIWLDAGFTDALSAQRRVRPHIVPVFGTESLQSAERLVEALRLFGPTGMVLSLDYRKDEFVGPRGLDMQSDLWPRTVILMTLDRVGMREGPDFDRLEALVTKAAGRSVFAAGGVRDVADIERLASVGVAGALIATALHEGKLPADLLLRCV